MYSLLLFLLFIACFRATGAAARCGRAAVDDDDTDSGSDIFASGQRAYTRSLLLRVSLFFYFVVLVSGPSED